MESCKKCGSNSCVKNGIVKSVQRFKCKDCGCNFRIVDGRKKPQNELKKILAILMHSSMKSSFGQIAKLLAVSDVSVMKWIKSYAKTLPEPEIPEKITDIEFDELWHFVKKNRKNTGYSGRFAVFLAKFSDIYVGIAIKKLSKNFTKDSNI